MITYATAAAFKQALEARLRSASSSGTDFARRRQLLVFDRFLARIARELGDAVMLKGGIVVELRVDRARTTKDVDLRVMGTPTGLLERLARAAQLELGDFMLFTVAPDAEHPDITNEGMVYEGQRYRVNCKLAGKPYGQPFASTSRLQTRSSGSPTSLWPTTSSALPASRRRRCASIRSKRTSPRRFTHTPSRASVRTRGSRTCPTSRSSRAFATSRDHTFAARSRKRSIPEGRTRCLPPFRLRRPHGRRPTRAWSKKTSCAGRTSRPSRSPWRAS